MDSTESDCLITEECETVTFFTPTLKDRGYVIYIIFYLLGIGSLLPWNFFSNAQEYFKYKLRNVTFTNVSNYDIPEYERDWQIKFENYIALAAMIPNVLFLFLNTAVSNRICVNKRIVVSLSIMIVMFVVTIVLTKVNTDQAQNTFFVMTISSIILMNVGSAVFQGAVFGLSSTFPKQYPQAVMAGMGMGGTIAAGCNMMTVSIGDNPVISAFYFFMAALVVLVLSGVGYLCLPYNKFALEHLNAKHQYVKINDTSNRSDKLSMYQVFRKMDIYAASVFAIFLVTLTCYPAITGSIKSMHSATYQSSWFRIYYPMFSFFLLYNFFDWLGRTLVGFVQWPREHQKIGLLVLCLLRLCFVPAFLLCNVQPRKQWLPVMVDNDLVPIVLSSALGLSNGYLGTLIMLYGPRQVTNEYKEMAGSMMTFFISIGLASGSLLSLLLKIVYLQN